MKNKFSTLAVALGLAVSTQLSAQVLTNGNLDTWFTLTDSAATETPDNWYNFNILKTQARRFPTTVTKVMGVGSASSAVQIENGVVPASLQPNLPPYISGVLSYGDDLNGVPYTSRPTTFEFDYKCTIMGTDSVIALAQFKKNGALIGVGAWITGTANATTFQHISKPIQWVSPATPDTLELFFITNYANLTRNKVMTAANMGTTLTVDNVMLSGATASMSDLETNTNFTVYPTIATTTITVKKEEEGQCTLIMIDLSGKIVKNSILNTNETTISTTGMANGIYFYQIADNDTKIVKIGKIEIAN